MCRVRFLLLRTEVVLLDKGGVRKTVFESPPEPSQAWSNCVLGRIGDTQMLNRQAHATRNRVLEVIIGMLQKPYIGARPVEF